MMRGWSLAMAAVATLLLTSACSAASPAGALPLPLTLLADVPLGQPTARYDYASIDPLTGQMFVADLAGGRMLVFSLASRALTQAVPNLPKAHGVLAVPDQGRVYVSATDNNEVVAIDAKTLNVIWRGPSGYYPDGMAWAPGVHKLYVSDEHGQTVAVMDGATGRLVTLIKIGGDVGNTQFNPADGLIYTNDQSANELVAINPASDTIVARWAVPGCDQNHGLSVDGARQIAYITCQGNAVLVVFSLETHSTVATQPVGADPDVIAVDARLNRLYVAAESGTVTAFDIADRIPVKLGEEKLADNAHIVAVDPGTHTVYFPLRDVNGKPVMRIMAPSAAHP